MGDAKTVIPFHSLVSENTDFQLCVNIYFLLKYHVKYVQVCVCVSAPIVIVFVY